MSIHSDYPLISCLCLTENRVAFLEGSIQCFLNQSYPNKELLIVFPAEDVATSHFLKASGHPLVPVPFENSTTISLGAKRNLAIQKSNGNYFCVWDDDDWHHPDRLMKQYSALVKSNTRSCVLSRILLYDGITKKSYLSGKRQAWEGTLLCDKSVTENSFMYADLSKGEDSVLLANLLKHNLTLAIDIPELYIYTHHGHNTWNRDHWENNIVRWGRLLPDELSDLVDRILLRTVSPSESGAALNELNLKLRQFENHQLP